MAFSKRKYNINGGKNNGENKDIHRHVAEENGGQEAMQIRVQTGYDPINSGSAGADMVEFRSGKGKKRGFAGGVSRGHTQKNDRRQEFQAVLGQHEQ